MERRFAQQPTAPQVGKDAVDTFLPPVVTVFVAAIIGFGMTFAALDMGLTDLSIAVTVLFVTVLFSVYLQGRSFAGMLPILLSAIFGFLLAAVVDPGSIGWGAVQQADWFALPTIAFPISTGAFVATAIASILIITIASIPESTAHLYQIGRYVDRFAEEWHPEKSHLDKYIGMNQIFVAFAPPEAA